MVDQISENAKLRKKADFLNGGDIKNSKFCDIWFEIFNLQPPENKHGRLNFWKNMFYNIIFEHFLQLWCYNNKLPEGRRDKRITKI